MKTSENIVEKLHYELYFRPVGLKTLNGPEVTPEE